VADEHPLDAAYEAADRLVREAEEAARARAGDVPPRGWQEPGSQRSAFTELAALAGLIDAARTSVPPEVAQQLVSALRELLVALRALLDWWIERLDREPEPPVEVEDIPIQ
jgi:hypothetical protein